MSKLRISGFFLMLVESIEVKKLIIILSVMLLVSCGTIKDVVMKTVKVVSDPSIKVGENKDQATKVSLSINASNNININLYSEDSDESKSTPLEFKVIQLKDNSLFQGIDFDSLSKSLKKALGTTYLNHDDYVIEPGQFKYVDFEDVDVKAKYIAVIGFYNDIDNSTWKAITKIKPTGNEYSILLQFYDNKMEIKKEGDSGSDIVESTQLKEKTFVSNTPSNDVNEEDGIAAENDDVAVGNDDVAAGNDDVAVGNDDVAAGNDDVAVGNDDVAVDKEKAIVDKDDLASVNEDPVVNQFRHVKNKIWEKNRDYYQSTIETESQKNNISPDLINAVIMVESSYDASAVSSAGAFGLMQIIPDTGEMYGYEKEELLDGHKNIEVGTLHLARLYHTVFERNLELTLAAYNAGATRVKLHYGNTVPPYKETKSFIKKVLFYYNKYQKESKSKV